MWPRGRGRHDTVRGRTPLLRPSRFGVLRFRSIHLRRLLLSSFACSATRNRHVRRHCRFAGSPRCRRSAPASLGVLGVEAGGVRVSVLPGGAHAVPELRHLSRSAARLARAAVCTRGGRRAGRGPDSRRRAPVRLLSGSGSRRRAGGELPRQRHVSRSARGPVRDGSVAGPRLGIPLRDLSGLRPVDGPPERGSPRSATARRSSPWLAVARRARRSFSTATRSGPPSRRRWPPSTRLSGSTSKRLSSR